MSLRSYESGSEILVIADMTGYPTVKLVCSPGPGPPPSAIGGVGDVLSVSGRCVFEGGIPSIFCRYNDVSLVAPSEDALSVGLLEEGWRLFEGDRFFVRGVCAIESSGAARLCDPGGACSFALQFDQGVVATAGEVLVDCTLLMDRGTMSLVLLVHAMTPGP